MKLSPEALELVKQLRLEAEAEHTQPDGSFCVRAVASTYVAKVTDLHRFGHDWVDEYLTTLLVIGAQEKLRDDRRVSAPGVSRRGVTLPETVASVDVHGNALRRPFKSLDLAGVVAYRAKERKRRDGAIDRIHELDWLIAVMKRDGFSTAGEAMAAQAVAA